MGMGTAVGSGSSLICPPISCQHLLLLLWKVLHQPFPRRVHLQILHPSRLHRQPLPPVPL